MRTPVLRNLVGDLSKNVRQPSTLSALERRWFVGRQSLKKAQEKHNTIDKRLLESPTLGGNLELVGVSAMLQLAEAPFVSPPLVTVQPSLVAPGWTEIILRVPVGLRGNKRGAAKPHARMEWKINGATMGEKRYFVHDSVAAAGRRYILHVAQQTALDPVLKPQRTYPRKPQTLPSSGPLDPGDDPDAELSPYPAKRHKPDAEFDEAPQRFQFSSAPLAPLMPDEQTPVYMPLSTLTHMLTREPEPLATGPPERRTFHPAHHTLSRCLSDAVGRI